MKTNIGISEKNRKEVSDILGKLLADEFVLYTKTLRAHWNLEGHDFHTKHVFFEEHYDAIKLFTDSVAERIRKIGHYAPGTLKEFLNLTNLSEKYDGDNTSHDYTVALLKDHDSIIQYIRENLSKVGEDCKDVGSEDFLTGLMQEHEEMAWMLRATVAK
ncbi:DNA starvation/stationary phase protection protein [Polaribacter vadi]|jgi:starvation-inducible DNA-binding protein|uniref:DNA starvation/stationary phase protection protein n=1 Tax=Polaribacter vadi TaxID=1774273 RepID=A0A1B8U3R0_9FLAO|nr:Dps family protein [Polaribacter vadi]AOW17617.1 DNA starvation/stationary phase protection protein [Polaribacter vadi]OBY66496.1 DNA starvation/stationary phase protection protein [Polaribacter vadi]|tara:strand:+ start:211 stop:687 length:477 start_codon:yes stop_codon:yes gene_type:complete